MYSSEDLERFYFQYQTEGLPKGISIQDFCIKNKVPYNIFSKWYKDTRKRIKDALISALTQKCDITYEVIVVDNNPERNDETEELLKE